jgi:hypothetical protein
MRRVINFDATVVQVVKSGGTARFHTGEGDIEISVPRAFAVSVRLHLFGGYSITVSYRGDEVPSWQLALVPSMNDKKAPEPLFDLPPVTGAQA